MSCIDACHRKAFKGFLSQHCALLGTDLTLDLDPQLIHQQHMFYTHYHHNHHVHMKALKSFLRVQNADQDVPFVTEHHAMELCACS